eukprot:g7967.t1
MIPVIRAERVKFTRMADMARCQNISLETIQKAILETPERLSEHSGAAGTAALLTGVVSRLGGTSAFNNYGIFATFNSGCYYLLTSDPANFLLFSVACFLDGCIGPLQADLISLLTSAIITQNETAAIQQIAFYVGSLLLNLVCYIALVRSYSHILARGTAWVQIQVAEKMLAMSSKYASTYGSGSINATFASDILRLQDLWTGIMWSLLSPLFRVLITIIYAFTVSPQVGVLALSVFPIIFVTVPQGSSSVLAASYSMAAAETIDACSQTVVLGRANGADSPVSHSQPDWERQISPMQYGDLDVSRLSFCYPGRNEFAIHDVSFNIPAGKFVALVGGSGCGKSTLLSLLMTWLCPSEGTISLGEEEMEEAKKLTWEQKVQREWFALEFAPPEVKDRQYRDFMVQAAEAHVQSLKYADIELRASALNHRNRTCGLSGECMEKASWLALGYADKDLLRNERLVLEAVRLGGLALRYAAKEGGALPQHSNGWQQPLLLFGRQSLQELHEDHYICLTAVKQDWRAMQFVAKKLLYDLELAAAAVKHTWHAFACLPEKLRGDRHLAHDAVVDSWCALKYCSAELRADRELAREAVQQCWKALEIMDPAFLSDREFAMIATRQNPEALKLLAPELMADRELIVEAVRQDWRAWSMASVELRDDEELLKMAMDQDVHALEFASERLKAEISNINTAMRTLVKMR